MRSIVIGAGIFGASVAYSLARAGTDVVVVDKGHQGKATLAGAGIVCPWATQQTDPNFTRIYNAGADYYHRELIPELEAAGIADTGYRRVGGLVLSSDEEQLKTAEARILPRTDATDTAGKVRRVRSDEVRTLFPPLREGLMGLHIEGGARVEARRVAAALLEAAQKMGAEVMHGKVDLSLEGGSPRASLDGTPLHGDRIVVTAGAWANEILDRLGTNIPVYPQRGQIVHLRLEGRAETAEWPVLMPQTSHYMLAFEDGRIVVGATRENDAGFDYRLTAAGQAEVLNFALELAPGLADATHIETRIGFRPYRADVIPMIGEVEGCPGLFIGNGLGAGGLTMGPIAGKLLAQAALGHKTDLDLSNYRVPA